MALLYIDLFDEIGLDDRLMQHFSIALLAPSCPYVLIDYFDIKV